MPRSKSKRVGMDRKDLVTCIEALERIDFIHSFFKGLDTEEHKHNKELRERLGYHLDTLKEVEYLARLNEALDEGAD